MLHYVALLRGINVGGNNVIKMADLKRCFEDADLADVATYIQSGNVLFATAETDPAALAERLERALADRFAYHGRLVLRSRAQLRAIVADAPPGFGGEPDTYRYDVAFLRPPLTAAEALPLIPTRDGVDQSFPGEGAIYLTRLIARATQSYVSRIIGQPVYQSMTIRNWNTTLKLRDLLTARADD